MDEEEGPVHRRCHALHRRERSAGHASASGATAPTSKPTIRAAASPMSASSVGDQNLDLVPWRLIQAALDDADAIASALEAVIEMRENEAAEAKSETDGAGDGED